MKCTRLGCQATATARIDAPNGGHWFGCDEHQDAMYKALSIGCAAELTATVVKLGSKRGRAG